MLTGRLWRHPDFLRLWGAQTVSSLGTGVTHLALPLTAAIALEATPSQMGILGAAEYLPFLLVGLFAGVWSDRLPRRPILIVADLGRAVLLGLIPLAALAGALRIELLYAVGFLAGVLTVFFDVAYQSYLPALVDRDALVEGNGKLEVSRSVAQVTSPAIGGVLVQLVTAPVAIAADAASFLGSALLLACIRRAEVRAPASGRNVWREIGEGLEIIASSPVLRGIATCTSTSNMFSNIAQTVFVLYVTRELNVTPAELGVILAIGSVGAVVGALFSGAIGRRFGTGPTIILTAALFPVQPLLTASAGGAPTLLFTSLVVAQVIGTFLGPVYNVNQVSLRQAITPLRLQGRMNASMRFIVWGTIPIGALIGGYLGDHIGLRATMIFGGLASLVAVLPVLFSPVRTLTRPPAQT